MLFSGVLAPSGPFSFRECVSVFAVPVVFAFFLFARVGLTLCFSPLQCVAFADLRRRGAAASAMAAAGVACGAGETRVCARWRCRHSASIRHRLSTGKKPASV